MEICEFPYIRDDSGILCFGGSQKWYRQKYRRLAGCGPTCAANLAAFHRIGVSPDDMLPDGSPVYTFSHYLDLMDRLWEYVKPGLRGFPWRGRFQEKFLQYASDCGTVLETDFLEGWTGQEAPLSFVQEEAEAGRPLALLILGHAEKTLDEETWHWMTVVGYDPDDDSLIISNYGKKQRLPASLVFTPGKDNDVHQISLSRA